jgi:predicted transcriptional regulator
MAMTLRLPPHLDAEIRAVAEEEHRSVHQAVVHAVEQYLAGRETADLKADADALRSLAEAREAVRAGDVVYGTDAIQAMVRGRHAS